MFTRIASTIVIAGGIATSALAVAGTANALSPDDVTFLNDLKEFGFNVEDPSQAITYAHLICEDLYDGATFTTVENKLADAETALTADDTFVFVNAAVIAYCPDQWGAPE